MIAEKIISRTENFLIGIFFAMVGMVVGTKSVFNHNVKSYRDS
jgi:Kef-type K+ transport system membrane component KefB